MKAKFGQRTIGCKFGNVVVCLFDHLYLVSDGFSCIHRFEVDVNDEGKATVSYRSRRTVDEYLNLVKKNGRLDSITFAAKRDLCKTVFQKIMGIFVAKRNAKNVGVTVSINMPGGGHIQGEKNQATINGHSSGIATLHAKTDASIFKKINPETLEPEGLATQV
jgi:torulene dioxygenase